MQTIRVRDFSKFPGGRYKRFGEYSGEEFRESVLRKALASSDDQLEIDLSEIFTFQPSFLDEAFAGLIRKGLISKREFKRRFVFTADPPNRTYIKMIGDYVDEASFENSGASAA